MPKDTLIIIPAYNAAASIDELIRRLTAHVSLHNIVVIDDGSGDSTGDIARQAGATVLTHSTNRGKGVALRTGFDHAIENNYDAVITIDADLQHDPNCIPKFKKLAGTGRYDIIIGSRKRTSNMPIMRALSNFASSVVVSFFAGARIRDSQSGYRWISTDMLKRFHLEGDRYDLETEIIIRVGKLGGSIGEIRVPTIYEHSVSYINPLSDISRALIILARSIFW